jgi:biopolymer transport protein ExbD
MGLGYIIFDYFFMDESDDGGAMLLIGVDIGRSIVTKGAIMTFCEFRSTLTKPDTLLEISAVISVLLFIFGLSLLGSRFVFSPGIEIELPRAKGIDLEATSGVLNLGPNGIIMFNNNILKIEDLSFVIEQFLSHKKDSSRAILLVCIDQWVPFGFVVRVTDILKSLGCQRIQIACEPENIS